MFVVHHFGVKVRMSEFEGILLLLNPGIELGGVRTATTTVLLLRFSMSLVTAPMCFRGNVYLISRFGLLLQYLISRNIENFRHNLWFVNSSAMWFNWTRHFMVHISRVHMATALFRIQPTLYLYVRTSFAVVCIICHWSFRCNHILHLQNIFSHPSGHHYYSANQRRRPGRFPLPEPLLASQ